MYYKFFRSALTLILVIGLAAISAPQSVRAAGPWYVSTTGDDNNDCMSSSTPCATINGAIGKASAGDIINVAIGTYIDIGTGTEVALIEKDITLSGGWDAGFTTQSGASTIDGEHVRGGIAVRSGATALMDRFTIQNGFGPGIVNLATLTLDNSIVTFNTNSGIVNLATLTLNNSIVTFNSTTGNGGGIFNNGSLIVNNSIISNNTATGYIGNYQGGGGIYNGGMVTLNKSTLSMNTGFGITSEGSLTIDNSTISDNTGYGIANLYGSNAVIEYSNVSNNTGDGIFNRMNLSINNSTIRDNLGHGIQNWNSGVSILNNSTVSGNMAGGILQFSGGTLFLNSSTISSNTSDSGGGIFIDSGTAILQNSILAGNTANSSPDCIGIVGSSGYNLIGDNSGCTFTANAGDLIGISGSPINPLLTPLQDNGGTTFTHALLSGSPAIDAGNPAGCTDQDGNPLNTDQRGISRPQGTVCDIGAFELEIVNQTIQVSIDIKPGDARNRIEIKRKDHYYDDLISVAILSTAQFNASQQVDKKSLTFGATGDETSLILKGRKHLPDCQVKDVNKDRLPDLVCSFMIIKTGFQLGDTIGILKGMTLGGTPIIGQDSVKIKRSSHEYDDHNHNHHDD